MPDFLRSDLKQTSEKQLKSIYSAKRIRSARTVEIIKGAKTLRHLHQIISAGKKRTGGRFENDSIPANVKTSSSVFLSKVF